MEGHEKEPEVTPEMINPDFILDENMRELGCVSNCRIVITGRPCKPGE
jgi:hypothetical protein